MSAGASVGAGASALKQANFAKPNHYIKIVASMRYNEKLGNIEKS